MNDPIVEEVRRVRAAHAERFNYDLDAIFRDIKEQEKRSGRQFVSFARDGSVLPPAPEGTVEPNMALPRSRPVPTASDKIPSQQGGPEVMP